MKSDLNYNIGFFQLFCNKKSLQHQNFLPTPAGSHFLIHLYSLANIIEIRDLSAPGLDVYARLTEAQLRNRLEPEKGIFIAESPKVILRALDAGIQPLSLLMERKQIDGPHGT